MNSRSYIASVIASYWVVSISMVYLNKMLLSSDEVSIPAPIFVTWYQCVLTCIICIVLGQMGERYRIRGLDSMLTEYPVIVLNPTASTKVLPLSLVFVGMIAFNNICLQYVAVSFYNVARSLSIVFNVIFTYLILGRSTNSLTCCTLAIVCFGFYIGIDGEIDFSLLGTVAGVMSSVFVSLNSIFTTWTLPLVSNDKSLLLFYNNLNASLLFIPLIFLFERDILLENFGKLFSIPFWFSMNITGIMGFCIGLVTVLQVKATSPLTHNISGTAKAAAQSLLAFYIWGNKATIKGLMGIFAVLFGSGLYTWVQMNSGPPPPPKK